jgi:hypothetical protein
MDRGAPHGEERSFRAVSNPWAARTILRDAAKTPLLRIRMFC